MIFFKKPVQEKWAWQPFLATSLRFSAGQTGGTLRRTTGSITSRERSHGNILTHLKLTTHYSPLLDYYREKRREVAVLTVIADWDGGRRGHIQ